MKDSAAGNSELLAPHPKKQTPSSAEELRKSYRRPELNRLGTVASLTQNGGGSASDGTGSSMTITMVYLFDYKPEYRDAWGHGRQFGVMADEVEKVMSEAVSVHPDGYKMVDYAMLGITRTLQ